MSRLLCLLALVAAMPVAAQTAPPFPERALRIVVPFAAGGATDVGARVLAEALGGISAFPVVVENRVGGAGLVGAEVVARAAPDGHTLLFNNTSQAVLRVVVPNASFDPITALTPVAILTEMPMVTLVANSFPATDGPGFIAAVRANPGRYDFGSSGGGGTLMMASLLFTRAAGLDMNEIPYRGGAPATLDLIAGRIALVHDIALTGLQTARSGQARAFAVSGPQRSPTAPDVPTWREVGIDAEMVVWQGVFAPTATPPAVQAALHAMLARAQAREQVQTRWRDLGVDRSFASSPADSARYFAAEVVRWEALLRNRQEPTAPMR